MKVFGFLCLAVSSFGAVIQKESFSLPEIQAFIAKALDGNLPFPGLLLADLLPTIIRKAHSTSEPIARFRIAKVKDGFEIVFTKMDEYRGRTPLIKSYQTICNAISQLASDKPSFFYQQAQEICKNRLNFDGTQFQELLGAYKIDASLLGKCWKVVLSCVAKPVGSLNDDEKAFIRMLHDEDYTKLLHMAQPLPKNFSDTFIGKGGFSKVYSRTYEDGRIVAVKQIALQPGKLSPILREIEGLQSVRNAEAAPYFVQLERIEFSAWNQIEIITEHIDGINGQQLIDFIYRTTGKLPIILPVGITAAMIKHLLKGLEYLHSKDLFHCDLKWENVAFSRTGQLKILDMGLVNSPNRHGWSFGGTLSYGSPEFHRNDQAAIHSGTDFWSLGIMLSTVMIYRSPRNEKNPDFGKIFKDMLVEVAALFHANPTIREVLIEQYDFVRACLQVNLADRYSLIELQEMTFIERAAPEEAMQKWIVNILEVYFRAKANLLALLR